jgi:hypothetical protein
MRVSLFFIVFLAGISFVSKAQSSCKSSIKVTQVRSDIKLNVSGSGDFSGKLIQYEGINEIVVKEFSGVNTKSFLFENLKVEKTYRVKITFHNEQDFLCRTKVSEFIDLKGDK